MREDPLHVLQQLKTASSKGATHPCNLSDTSNYMPMCAPLTKQKGKKVSAMCQKERKKVLLKHRTQSRIGCSNYKHTPPPGLLRRRMLNLRSKTSDSDDNFFLSSRDISSTRHYSKLKIPIWLDLLYSKSVLLDQTPLLILPSTSFIIHIA
jgi:hypothetical protein